VSLRSPSPNQFYATFLKVTDEQKAPRIGGSNRERTEGFRKVVPVIAQEINMTPGRERCFKLDAFFYCEHVSCFRPADRWIKYISVALEHENDPDYSAEEVIKLQRVNTPLAVLVTYPQTQRKGDALLETFATIIQEADVFANASKQRRQMCIFGYPGDPDAGWRGFVYQGNRFEALVEAPKTALARD
jgi:hypothetical protein